MLIRQQPGPHNSMGRMKFMFPNNAGIYLHDNPERQLFDRGVAACTAAAASGSRMPRGSAEWLFGRELDWRRRRARAAGDAAAPGAGLHHVSDRDADSFGDRIFRGRLRPRFGASSRRPVAASRGRRRRPLSGDQGRHQLGTKVTS